MGEERSTGLQTLGKVGVVGLGLIGGSLALVTCTMSELDTGTILPSYKLRNPIDSLRMHAPRPAKLRKPTTNKETAETLARERC